MYNTNKSLSIQFLVGFAALVLAVFTSSAVADPNLPVPNQLPDDMQQQFFMLEYSGGQALSFDPNLYSFLVYDPHNDPDSDIQQAMAELGISNYDVRSADNHVTPTDLNTHDILIVGWNDGGYMSGLSKDVIGSGITGRVLLTGHDADYHTAHTLWRTPKAKTFLTQAINYVLEGGGTGLVALGDYSAGFIDY